MDKSIYWKELHDELIEKLNDILRDQDKSVQLGFFFEPISENANLFGDSEIFTFTNPFKKYYIKFKKYFSDDESENKDVELIDRDVSETELQEMLNALDHVETQYKKQEIKNINEPHWDPARSNEYPYLDYFETEEELIISVEVPQLSNNDVDIRASTEELEITAGDQFHRVIKIQSMVNPDSAVAKYDGKGLIEVKFQKIPPSMDYTTIKLE